MRDETCPVSTGGGGGGRRLETFEVEGRIQSFVDPPLRLNLPPALALTPQRARRRCEARGGAGRGGCRGGEDEGGEEHPEDEHEYGEADGPDQDLQRRGAQGMALRARHSGRGAARRWGFGWADGQRAGRGAASDSKMSRSARWKRCMRVLSAGGRCALLAVGPPRRRGERVRRGPAHGTTPARPSTIDGFSRVPSLSFRKQRWILVLAFSSFPAMGSMPLPPFCPILVSMSERKESTSRLGPGLPFKVGSGLRELATGSFRSTMPPGTDCRTPATPRKSCANSPQRVRPGTAHPSEPTPPSAAASVSASPTACAVAPDPRAAPMSAEQPMFLHEGLSPNFICGGTRPTAELSLSLGESRFGRCAAGKYGGRGGAGRASADLSRVVVVGGGWQPISAAVICSRGICYGAPPSPCVPPLLPGTFDLLAGQGALRQPTPSTRLSLCAARSYRCVPYFAPLWVADRQAAAARFARARRSAPRRFAWRS